MELLHCSHVRIRSRQLDCRRASNLQSETKRRRKRGLVVFSSMAPTPNPSDKFLASVTKLNTQFLEFLRKELDANPDKLCLKGCSDYIREAVGIDLDRRALAHSLSHTLSFARLVVRSIVRPSSDSSSTTRLTMRTNPFTKRRHCCRWSRRVRQRPSTSSGTGRATTTSASAT